MGDRVVVVVVTRAVVAGAFFCGAGLTTGGLRAVVDDRAGAADGGAVHATSAMSAPAITRMAPR